MEVDEWWMEGGWTGGCKEGNTIICQLREVLVIQAWMVGPEKKLSGGAGGDCVHELRGMEDGPKRSWKEPWALLVWGG